MTPSCRSLPNGRDAYCSTDRQSIVRSVDDLNNMHRSVNVYIVSGPLGVGKSTVSRTLAGSMRQSALIEGDLLLHLYRGETEPPWADRLRIAWSNIAAVTRNLASEGIDVVIDFVVEEELPWFREQLAELDAKLYYAVLHAKPDTLLARLRQRGDEQYIERSLFLREKLTASPDNGPYLLNTEAMDPEGLARTIATDARFRL